MSDTEVLDRIKGIVDTIADLRLDEVCQLVDALQGRFGIDSSAMMAMPVAGPAVAAEAGAAAEVKEEKTSFDLCLKSFNAQKTKVIKAVKDIKKDQGQDISLKDVKDLVEAAPSVICEGLSKDKFEQYCTLLKDAGAEAGEE